MSGQEQFLQQVAAVDEGHEATTVVVDACRPPKVKILQPS